MHIEDIIHQSLIHQIKYNKFDQVVMTSFADQIIKGNAFTQKQATLAVKICKKYYKSINQLLNVDILPFLENPSFKLGNRIVRDSKIMKIVQNNLDEKIIAVEFPYKEEIIQKIRANRQELFSAFWNADAKYWEFSLDEQSLNFLYELHKDFNFPLDDEVQNYMNQIKSIRHNLENFVPMLSSDGEQFKIINSSVEIPAEISTNIIKVLFFARKCGIFTWDDKISEILSKNDSEGILTNFLNSDPTKIFQFSSDKKDKSAVFNIISNLLPVLVIIPPGKELEILEHSVQSLQGIGIDNREMSVLFRLQNDTGANFNNFVKINKLNNPLDNNSKVCFVSGKLPKTIFLSNLKFNCVLNYNSLMTHYTIKEFVNHNENVINLNQISNKEEQFWLDAEL